MKKRKLLFFSLLLWAAGLMAQTHLSVVPLSGVEQQTAIAQIGKITFAEEVMYLYDHDGGLLGSTAIADIAKILFVEPADTPTSTNAVSEAGIQIYPNPSQESITVRGVLGTQVIRIYSMQGHLMQSATCENGDVQINIGGLQNSTYLLQVGAQAVKIIKQ